jgi:histidinol-phosphate/aromatic aminotransferase/cobyric acid decarboxylase-like protein
MEKTVPLIPAPRPSVKPGNLRLTREVLQTLTAYKAGLIAGRTSPKAVEAYRQAAATLKRYPDGTAAALREVLGVVHGIDSAAAEALNVLWKELSDGQARL